MSRLFPALLLFLLVGWALPVWSWAEWLILLGILTLLAGLGTVLASFQGSSPTGGFGGVLVAFLGICITLIGASMTAYRTVAEAALRFIGGLPTESVIVGGMLAGFVLAAAVRSKGR
jgi:hypothetical protein